MAESRPPGRWSYSGPGGTGSSPAAPAGPSIKPFGPQASVPPGATLVDAGPHSPPLPIAMTTLLIGSSVLVAIPALVALLAEEPLLFPSLGPTALLLYSRPLPPELSIRNVIVAHFVGIGVGWLALAAFELRTAPSVLSAGVTGPRLGAAALSVGVTAALLRLLRSPHAPAAASTMIVSLGLLKTGPELGMMAASVVLIALVGWATNLLVGQRVPWLHPRHLRVHADVGEVLPRIVLPYYPSHVAASSQTQLFPRPTLRPQRGSGSRPGGGG